MLIRQQLGPLLVDLVPGWTSLLVHYDLLRVSHQQLQQQLTPLLEAWLGEAPQAVLGPLLELPIWYAGEDLLQVVVDRAHLPAGSSPVSGLGYDCVYDQQVPLRGNRQYTVVVSKPADRPKNATPACGYRWMTFGKGENYPDPAARDWIGVLYMRFMAANPSFKQAPQNVKTPGTEAKVMGPYFPRSSYTTKSAFEKRGCK